MDLAEVDLAAKIRCNQAAEAEKAYGQYNLERAVEKRKECKKNIEDRSKK